MTQQPHVHGPDCNHDHDQHDHAHDHDNGHVHGPNCGTPTRSLCAMR